MRVLVAADAMVGLDPRGASEVIGQAFADVGAQVAVVPLADGGPWFPGTVAAFNSDASVAQPATLAEFLSCLHFGATVSYVDLTGLARHAWDELTAIGPDDVDALHSAMAGRELVAVVATGGRDSTLTGLTGVVAERGRLDGNDLADTLSADTAVSRWVDELGVDGTVPGTGAADGVGAVVLALGGRITTGIEACVRGFDVAGTVAKADLVVTGSSVLDFHAVGGDVVKEMSVMAASALCPIVAIVGRNYVSSRELRLGGIESAHPILDGPGADEPIPAQLAEVAAAVARSWKW